MRQKWQPYLQSFIEEALSSSQKVCWSAEPSEEWMNDDQMFLIHQSIDKKELHTGGKSVAPF